LRSNVAVCESRFVTISPVVVQLAGRLSSGVAVGGGGIVAGIDGTGVEGDGVAIVAAADVVDVGTGDGPAPPVQATMIRARATVAVTRRVEAGIGCPPHGLLP
jgi:hypothetical protein